MGVLLDIVDNGILSVQIVIAGVALKGVLPGIVIAGLALKG